MHPEQQRSPLLIFIFTVIGSSMRYGFFYLLYQIKGEKPKGFYAFSDGFKQIVYNLLIMVLLVIGGLILIAYYAINSP
jgi:hypothetical protein